MIDKPTPANQCPRHSVSSGDVNHTTARQINHLVYVDAKASKESLQKISFN